MLLYNNLLCMYTRTWLHRVHLNDQQVGVFLKNLGQYLSVFPGDTVARHLHDNPENTNT